MAGFQQEPAVQPMGGWSKWRQRHTGTTLHTAVTGTDDMDEV